MFVFPDLNTGNTTYKAVQRSANVVSIGPMLQGLRKPVNDLSRGALVDDIVYTIALTAIQAQAAKKAAKRRRAAGGGMNSSERCTCAIPAVRALQLWRSAIIALISAIALAGLRPFGQVLAQFMMVWQR